MKRKKMNNCFSIPFFVCTAKDNYMYFLIKANFPPLFWFHQHFFALLFRTKVSYEAFLYFHFRFVLFWHKNISTKAARKMLVKLTPISFTITPDAITVSLTLHDLYQLN